MEENINSKEEHNKPAETPGRKDPQNDKSEDTKSPAEADKNEPTETTNHSKSQDTIPKGENSQIQGPAFADWLFYCLFECDRH